MKTKSMIFTIVITLQLNFVMLAQEPFCPTDTFEVMTAVDINSNDVAVIGSKFYTIDAYGSSKKLTEYNTGTGEATVINTPTFTLGETSLTSYNGDLYVFGGWTGSTTSNMAKKYSLSAGTWSSIANLPNAIVNTSAVILEDNIYVTGGTIGTTVQYFYKYNPSSNQYTTLAVPSTMCSSSKLFIYNDEIYSIGGHNWSGNYTYSDKMYKYNISTNTWSLFCQTPFALNHLPVAIWGDYLYVFGGGGDETSVWTPHYEYYVYDFVNDIWNISDEDLPNRNLGAAVAINDTIYLPYWQYSMKYYCGSLCQDDLVISPMENVLQFGESAIFTATSSSLDPDYSWQSDFGQGYQTLFDYGNYSGTNTNSLTISNIQLANHLQNIRVISTSNECIDTSNVAVIILADTCINNISVTDTLIINTPLFGIAPPNDYNTVKIYPNPASTYIVIDYGNYTFMEGYSLRIINSLSQTVFSELISLPITEVDLSTWTGNGLYFVQILDPENHVVVNRKIILE